MYKTASGKPPGRGAARGFLPQSLQRGIFDSAEEIMGTKVKPVQPTEIKDKKIAREVIEQIRKPIPAAVEKKLAKEDELIMKFFK
jgi:hypothetical protein